MSKPPILVAEDSNEDYTALMRAFKEVNITNPVHRFEEGDGVLDYLRQDGDYKFRKPEPRPKLILLDLNMPGTSGREVLVEIKQDKKLQDIPVIILTTSLSSFQIEACQREGADSYLVKPINFDHFVKTVRLLKNHWLT